MASMSGPSAGRTIVQVLPPSRAALEVHAPLARLLRRLGARRAEERPVGQPHRLVLDRAENAVRQPGRFAPRPAVVAGCARHAPPALRTRPDLIEQRQRAGSSLEQHGIPAGMARAVGLHAVGNLDRRTPLAADVAREPDADVGRALARAAEPGGHESVPASRRWSRRARSETARSRKSIRCGRRPMLFGWSRLPRFGRAGISQQRRRSRAARRSCEPPLRSLARLRHLFLAIAWSGAGVSERISLAAAAVTSSTAVLKASSLAREGRAVPLSLRTNCNADAWISSSVAGGSKFASVLMLRHMWPHRKPSGRPGSKEAGTTSNRGSGSGLGARQSRC